MTPKQLEEFIVFWSKIVKYVWTIVLPHSSVAFKARTRPRIKQNLRLDLVSYHNIDILSIYLPALISMMSFSPSGMGSVPNTYQRKIPRRPSLANTERGRQDHQGTKRASLPSWGASSVGCSFGDGRVNHGALAEANRTSKEVMRKNSAGQGILGKVRLMYMLFIFSVIAQNYWGILLWRDSRWWWWDHEGQCWMVMCYLDTVTQLCCILTSINYSTK